MALILVRHGRTAPNAQGRLLGRADPDLDDEGARQAAATAAALGPVTRLVSSPLRRARQTAAALGEMVEVDDRWVEIDYGDYEGRYLSELPPALWEAWRQDSGYTPPGGESLIDVSRRVGSACEELLPRIVQDDIVVVTHVSPIKAAIAWTLGVEEGVAWRMYVGVGSVTRITQSDGRPVMVSFNETHHLP